MDYIVTADFVVLPEVQTQLISDFENLQKFIDIDPDLRDPIIRYHFDVPERRQPWHIEQGPLSGEQKAERKSCVCYHLGCHPLTTTSLDRNQGCDEGHQPSASLRLQVGYRSRFGFEVAHRDDMRYLF